MGEKYGTRDPGRDPLVLWWDPGPGPGPLSFVVGPGTRPGPLSFVVGPGTRPGPLSFVVGPGTRAGTKPWKLMGNRILCTTGQCTFLNYFSYANKRECAICRAPYRALFWALGSCGPICSGPCSPMRPLEECCSTGLSSAEGPEEKRSIVAPS